MSFTRPPCDLARLSLTVGWREWGPPSSLVGDVTGDMPQQEIEPGAKGAVQLLAASANANFADKIAKALLRAGYRLDPGEFDPERIDAVVVLWTGVALDKPALIDVAKKAWKMRRLTPVSIGRVEPPFGSQDVAPMDLAGWRGDDADPRWRFVLSDIEALKARAGLEDDEAVAAAAAPLLLDDPITDDYAAPHHPAQALWRNRLLPAAPMLAVGLGVLAFAAGVSFMAGSLRPQPAPVERIAEKPGPAEAAAAPPDGLNLALVRLAPDALPPEETAREASSRPTDDAGEGVLAPGEVETAETQIGGAIVDEASAARDEESVEDERLPEAFAALAAPSLKPAPPEDPVEDALLTSDLNQAALAELAAAVEAAEGAGTRQDYLGDYFSDCEGCPDMAALDGGVFLMGARAAEQDRQPEETPQRRIEISYRFAIATRETTFEQWSLCVMEGGCRSYAPDDAGWGRGDRPVINVSYEDAAAYARWLSAKTGHYYRLPSEAEWEFAARAGTAGATHFGDYLSAADANFDGRTPYRAETTIIRGRTVPVTQFRHNAFGLFDMHGNVAEWTLDCWNPGHNGGPATGAARIGGDCARRVVKGGSWRSPGWRVRSAARRGMDAETRGPETGFRVVRVLD